MPEQMMRIAGRYENSQGEVYSKGVATNESGEQFVELAKNRVEVIAYDKDNPTENRGFDDYVLRSDNAKSHYFPHVLDFKSNHINIFEQSIYIISTLDVDLEVTISFGLSTSHDGIVSPISGNSSFKINTHLLEKKPSAPTHASTVAFLPETYGSIDDEVSYRNVIEVPELRQPVGFFVINLKPVGVPETGEVSFRSVRRY